MAANAAGLGTASQQQAAELQRLLEARGAKLPSLTSSPEVGASSLVKGWSLRMLGFARLR